MSTFENFVIRPENGNPLLADLYLCNYGQSNPIVIYCHGYKGFKDWGHVPLIPNEMLNAGFNFLKFNFSHNGGTLDEALDFPDLEAFANNNYSIELEDLKNVLDWIQDPSNPHATSIDQNNIYLMGHSRGGGIAILSAAVDPRIKKLVTWSAVGDFGRRFPSGEALEKWKKTGIMHVDNMRTKQKMPHYYQFYEDFIKNRNKLNIVEAEKQLTIPHLLIHGTQDETVYLGEALHLMSLNELASLIKIQGGTHTFGGHHPYKENHLPHQVEMALNYTITFFQNEGST